MGFDMTMHGIDPLGELGSQLAHTHLLLQGCNSYNKKLIQQTMKSVIYDDVDVPSLVKLQYGDSFNIRTLLSDALGEVSHQSDVRDPPRPITPTHPVVEV